MQQLHCSERVSNEYTSPALSSSYLFASMLRFHRWTAAAFSHDFYLKAIRDRVIVVRGSASKNSPCSGLTWPGSQKYFSLS
jgi:hypothetical protein